MKKRFLSSLLALALLLTMLPTAALAATTESLRVTADGTAVTGVKNDKTDSTVYTITSSGDKPVAVTVTGSTKTGCILIDCNADITLTDVAMVLDNCTGSTIEIADGKTVTITLEGNNELIPYAGGPGIQVGEGATLTIQGANNSNEPTLKVSGAKYFSYTPGEAAVSEWGGFAGIGSKNVGTPTTPNTSTINIKSGTINAYGFGYGAAIGGGDYVSGGTINISGGIVTAETGTPPTSGWANGYEAQASGIGGSQGCASGTITISGGAQVTAYGGIDCPGIGGAFSNVTIKDTTQVTAYGGKGASGIGGYDKNKGNSNISIEDNASVTAYGGEGASGIGQGSAASTVNLTIGMGATVRAYSDGKKAAITGTPEADNASILNLYMQNVTLPPVEIKLIITKEGGSAGTELSVPNGYKAVGATMETGNYTVAASVPSMGSIPLYGVANGLITAGSDEAAYNGIQAAPVSAPDKPTITSTKPTGSGQVEVTWTPPADTHGLPITGYKVYYNTAEPDKTGSAYTKCIETGDVTSATITDLQNSADYYFWVKAVNLAGESPRSLWWDCASFADGDTVDVFSATQMNAALNTEAITNINVAASFEYSSGDREDIAANKKITVKSGNTLTLTYSTSFYDPHYYFTCNSGITVENNAKIVFNHAFEGTYVDNYFVMNGDFKLEDGATATTSRNAKVETDGYILFRGGFDNNGSFESENANVYLNYGADAGTFAVGTPNYNLCLTTPVTTTRENKKLALTEITGDAYADGKLHVSVDGFGEVTTDGLFPIQWSDGSTAAEHTVSESDKGKTVTAVLTGVPQTPYSFFFVSEDGQGIAVDEITDFDSTSKSIAFANFVVTLDANGGSCEITKAIPNIDGKLTSLPMPTRTGNYSFKGWYDAASGGEEITLEKIYTEETTIYAQWTYNGGGSSHTYTITASAGEGGSISPSGSVSVREGMDQAFTITPEDGYAISDVLVDGVSVKDALTGSSYTFTNVQEAHTIQAAFLEESKLNPFTDVKDSDWFFKDVMFVYSRKLMNGTGYTTFSPNTNATRGMIATILYRLEGEPAISGSNPFDDVNSGSYYEKAITWAAANGIAGGYGNGRFGPDDSITREQMAAVLYRYASFKGYDVTGKADLSGFSDYGKISSYAVEAMAWANSEGIINGVDRNVLAPTETATRAQVAAMLTRFLNRNMAE